MACLRKCAIMRHRGRHAHGPAFATLRRWRSLRGHAPRRQRPGFLRRQATHHHRRRRPRRRLRPAGADRRASSRPAYPGQSHDHRAEHPVADRRGQHDVQHRDEGRHHHRAASARHPARQADLSVRRALRDREIPLARQPQQRDRGDAGVAHGSAQDDEGPVRQGADRRRHHRRRSGNHAPALQLADRHQIQGRHRLQQHRADRARGRARRGAGHRRLVVVEPQGGAAELARRQAGHPADAGRAEERAGARLAAERARLHQERCRPQGDGAALHAEDRGASAGHAAGGAGGAGRPAAQGVRDAGAGQGVPRRDGQGQDGVQTSCPVRRSTRSWRRSPRLPPEIAERYAKAFSPTESNRGLPPVTRRSPPPWRAPRAAPAAAPDRRAPCRIRCRCRPRARGGGRRRAAPRRRSRRCNG